MVSYTFVGGIVGKENVVLKYLGMNSIRHDKDKDIRIHEAILNDAQYQGLIAQKSIVYNTAGIQLVIGDKTGASANRNPNELIRQINKQIELRVDQIIEANT